MEVRLENLTKKWGPVIGTEAITLDIHSGEFVAFLGPSGCGKTTTLLMVAGIYKPTAGYVKFDGRIVNRVQPRDRNIGMVFQSYALYPHMTVRDNLAFGLKLRKVPKAEIDKRVGEAAGILDLGKYLDRKPKELSGGQRQRVALGRAIVREPAVFLMDEPLSNLDAKLRVQTRAEILRLHQRLETTMVYVTHDQTEAMTMGTRIAVMSDGKLQQVGSPQELYDRPVNKFVGGFIGSPAMNFIDVSTVASADGRLTLEGPGVTLPIPAQWREIVGTSSGRQIIAGFRPEHFTIGGAEDATAKFAATADVVEYLGSEELIHATVAGKDVVALLSSEHRVRPGDAIDLHVPLAKVHLFDSESNLSLTAQVAS